MKTVLLLFHDPDQPVSFLLSLRQRFHRARGKHRADSPAIGRVAQELALRCEGGHTLKSSRRLLIAKSSGYGARQRVLCRPIGLFRPFCRTFRTRLAAVECPLPEAIRNRRTRTKFFSVLTQTGHRAGEERAPQVPMVLSSPPETPGALLLGAFKLLHCLCA